MPHVADDAPHKITRKSFLKGAAGATLLGAMLAASGCDSSRKGETRLNVVLVILDSLRKDHVGAYGNGWIQTPNLDALARESLRFTRAYPEALPTLPARRAIHTGLRTFPFNHYEPEVNKGSLMFGWLPIPQEQTTLAQMLDEIGYETLLITDTYHQFKPEMNFHKGFETFYFVRGQETDRYKPYWAVSEETMRRYLPVEVVRTRHHLANTADRQTEEDYFAPQVFNTATQMLEDCVNREPFFMVVDSFDPHEPWDPPQKYVDLYSDDYEGPEPFCPAYRSTDYLTDRQLERMRALYAGEVTLVDHWLGRFLDKMNELGLMENTVLIALSDHGILLGEHDTTGKPHEALWPEVVDIPFFIRHPEAKKGGETSTYPASTHDIVSTVFGFLGTRPPEPVEGQDLSVIFDGEEPGPRPYATAGKQNFSWARDELYALIVRNDGQEAKLFDLQRDPGQTNDIAPSNPEVVKRMYDDYLLRDANGGPLLW